MQGLAETGRPLEPVRPRGRKAQTALPLFQALLHGACELLEQSVGHDRRAQAGKVGCRIIGFFGMGGTVHANAYYDGECRLAVALNQNTGDLGLLDKQIVRPLHFQVGS